MVKKLFAILMALVMTISVTACAAGSSTGAQTSSGPAASSSGTTAKAETFRLGVYQRYTGASGYSGVTARQAIELAAEHINANGGLNGAKIELISYDTQGLPEEAVKVVTKMIASDNINACIGSDNSAEVLAAAPYVNAAGIYHIGLGTSPSWMKQDWPFVFRACANTDIGTPLTAQLIKDIGYSSVVIFNGMDDSAMTTGTAFKEACEKIGIDVKGREQYDAADLDFSGQIIKLLGTKPDCVYMALSGAANPNFIKQLRQAGYTGMVFSKEGFTSRNIEIVGVEAANYIAFSDPYVVYADINDCDIPIMKDFLNKYVNKFKKLPDASTAAKAWDSMMVLWEAAKIAKSNESDALRQATHKVVIDGLGGKLDYTAGNREGYSKFNSFIVVNGKNLLWKKWVDDGGYKAYLNATKNAK